MANRPWARKRKSLERCSFIREAKKNKSTAVGQGSNELLGPEASQLSQESQPPPVVPQPDIEDLLHIDSRDSETDYDSDPDEDIFTNEKAQQCFDDFMVALPFDTRQMLAMFCGKKRQGSGGFSGEKNWLDCGYGALRDFASVFGR